MISTSRERLPAWLWPRNRNMGAAHAMKTRLRRLGLSTVCESSRCPNINECFRRSTATVMIMGDVCTRNCSFCSVNGGRPAGLDPEEPARVAGMVHELNLAHLVITSVNRDDLPDGGAAHFAACVEKVKDRFPKVVVEALTPDFQGDEEALEVVARAPFDVFNHNMETVRRLYGEVRPGARYDRSLKLLGWMTQRKPGALIKSGFMVGFGETRDETRDLMRDLRRQGVRALTVGQYLRPTPTNRPVARYLPPEEFDDFRAFAEELGFSHVASAPLVRSSYMADNFLISGRVS